MIEVEKMLWFGGAGLVAVAKKSRDLLLDGEALC
jgi:hypothetical protein